MKTEQVSGVIPPGTPVWYKGTKGVTRDGKEWRGVHRFIKAMEPGYAALELVQVEDPAYQGEEVIVSTERISTHIRPERLLLIKDLI